MPDLPPLPAIAAEPISVLLLAHNEEAHLEEVVSDWVTHLDQLSRPYEILIVDDGSTDHTGALARSLAERRSRIHVPRHNTALGVGAALRTGLAAAQFPLLLYTTCDHQYQPADLKPLLDEIDKVHVVSGFRQWRPMPTGLRWLGRLHRGFIRLLFGFPLQPLPGWLGWKEQGRHWMARLLFGVRLNDVSCEYRLFRREIFRRIPIQANGSFAHVEVLAKANFLGCYMHDEVPVRYQARADRSSRWTVKEACRVFFHPDFGPGPQTASRQGGKKKRGKARK